MQTQPSPLNMRKHAIQHTTPIVILLILFVLSACAKVDNNPAVPTFESHDILPPKSPVENFFGDLGEALRDPTLGDEQTRSKWVEQLVSNFAPNEQAEQRVILNDALRNFANDRAKLGEDETLTIEINLGGEPDVIIQGDRALVIYPNAQFFIQISRITENGIVPYYEQPIELGRLTGRTDKSIPTIRIGNRWYLTAI